MLTNIFQIIDKNGTENPDKTAVIYENTRLSYKELSKKSKALAYYLKKHYKLKPSDRVVILLDNNINFIIAYYAVQRLECITVTLSTQLKEEELVPITDNCQPNLCISGDNYINKIPNKHQCLAESILEAEIYDKNNENLDYKFDNNTNSPNRPAAIMYTSGTTNASKGVTLSFNNILSNVISASSYYRINNLKQSYFLLFLPLYHCFGQNAIMNTCFYLGETIILHEPSMKLIKESLINHNITHFFGVPTTYSMLIDDISCFQHFSSIPYFFSAGARLPLPIEKRWKEKFDKNIYQGYGLTETSPFATYNHAKIHKIGSIGTAIDNVEIKILSDKDNEKNKNDLIGEIAVKGQNVMLGYWNKEEETKNKIVDGWLLTGDIGRLDEDGYLYYIDRKDDLINISGKKVYPQEIELTIMSNDKIRNVIILDEYDSNSGNTVIHAYVETTGDFDIVSKEILEKCKNNLSKYKVPKKISNLDTLPKTHNGKLSKKAIKELLNKK